MSTRRQLVEPDVDTDEVPVGEDVHRWLDTSDGGSSYRDFIHRSSISFKWKEPTSISIDIGRALQTDDRLVPITPKNGARRAGRRQYYSDRGSRMATAMEPTVKLTGDL